MFYLILNMVWRGEVLIRCILVLFLEEYVFERSFTRQLAHPILFGEGRGLGMSHSGGKYTGIRTIFRKNRDWMGINIV